MDSAMSSIAALYVVSCHSSSRARKDGASRSPSWLPPEARSRKSSRNGTDPACVVTTQPLPTTHTIDTGSAPSGSDQGRDLDVQDAPVIVCGRPAGGTEQIWLGICGYAQPAEQGHDVLVREREDVDPQQLVRTDRPGADVAQGDLAIAALCVEEDGGCDGASTAVARPPSDPRTLVRWLIPARSPSALARNAPTPRTRSRCMAVA